MTSLLISWPGGSLESALRLFALVLLAYALVLWMSAIVWVLRDVKNRTSDVTSQLVAVLLVALFNLPGLVVYLVIRPQSTLADAYERSLEAEAILHELQMTTNSCQNCHRPIDEDFNICPHCKTVLREACRTCARPIRTSWAACPYCASDRVPARQPVVSRPLDGHTAPLMPPRRNPLQTVEPPAPSRPPVPGPS